MENSDFTGHIRIDPALSEAERRRLVSMGQLACGWVPDASGSRLRLSSTGYDEPAAALRYILSSFHQRGVDRFTGMVAGCYGATADLVSIQVRGGKVTEKVLWPGATQQRARRRAPQTETADARPPADVIDLESRRAR